MQAPENKRPKIRNLGVRILNGEQLKQKVGGGGIVYGTMISMGRNPGWGRTVGAFGLDYVIIDTEHAARSRSEVAD